MPYANDNQLTGYNRLQMQQRRPGMSSSVNPGGYGRQQVALPTGDDARFGQMYASMLGSIMGTIRRRRAVQQPAQMPDAMSPMGQPIDDFSQAAWGNQPQSQSPWTPTPMPTLRR